MSHILRNELYIGKVINGKQEVTDFLTGQRTDKNETDWIVVDKPGLRIIEDEAFQLAQGILQSRFDSFKMTHERQSNKFLFSALSKCVDNYLRLLCDLGLDNTVLISDNHTYGYRKTERFMWAIQ